MNIAILEPDNFSIKALDKLKTLGKVSFFVENGDLSPQEFLKNKDIIFVRLKFFIDEKLIDKNSLKYICSPTTGLNHISSKIQNNQKIGKVTLRGEVNFLKNIRATSEHSLGLGLALLRKYQFAFIKKACEWDRDKFRGQELYQRSVGIIGLGRVGTILSKYLDAFGCKVEFFDINKKIVSTHKQLKRVDSLKKLIKNNSLIFLCASYAENAPLILDKKHLIFMKNKYLVNTSRGELVDEESLIDLIKKDYFAGVAIDVLANETKQSRIVDFLALTKNHHLIVTPHIAGATLESMAKTEEFIVDKLIKEIGK
jgi:D-3-phosphoglycerate dehydrogenase / 2-oxoglutarate reductase